MSRIIRVFPRRTAQTPTDALSFVGDPPLEMFRPVADEVHVSVTFTWDVEKARRLVKAWQQFYPRVLIGGPALGKPSQEFVAGRYVQRGITFTSRGCYNRCPPCLVPGRQGRLRELTYFPPGHIVQDDNLLQCSAGHLDRVWAMLRQEHGVKLSGGLAPALVTDQVAEALQGIPIREVFLACDNVGELPALQKAARKLRALGREKLRCYVLLQFDTWETIDDATARLEDVWAAGCMPFAMLYQPPDRYIDYPTNWRKLQKHWTRPGFMKVLHKEWE